MPKRYNKFVCEWHVMIEYVIRRDPLEGGFLVMRRHFALQNVGCKYC